MSGANSSIGKWHIIAVITFTLCAVKARFARAGICLDTGAICTARRGIDKGIAYGYFTIVSSIIGVTNASILFRARAVQIGANMCGICWNRIANGYGAIAAHVTDIAVAIVWTCA